MFQTIEGYERGVLYISSIRKIPSENALVYYLMNGAKIKETFGSASEMEEQYTKFINVGCFFEIDDLTYNATHFSTIGKAEIGDKYVTQITLRTGQTLVSEFDTEAERDEFYKKVEDAVVAGGLDQRNSLGDFPSQGSSHMIYIAKDTGQTWYWDDNTKTYIKTGIAGRTGTYATMKPLASSIGGTVELNKTDLTELVKGTTDYADGSDVIGPKFRHGMIVSSTEDKVVIRTVTDFVFDNFIQVDTVNNLPPLSKALEEEIYFVKDIREFRLADKTNDQWVTPYQYWLDRIVQLEEDLAAETAARIAADTELRNYVDNNFLMYTLEDSLPQASEEVYGKYLLYLGASAKNGFPYHGGLYKCTRIKLGSVYLYSWTLQEPTHNFVAIDTKISNTITKAWTGDNLDYDVAQPLLNYISQEGGIYAVGEVLYEFFGDLYYVYTTGTNETYGKYAWLRSIPKLLRTTGTVSTLDNTIYNLILYHDDDYKLNQSAPCARTVYKRETVGSFLDTTTSLNSYFSATSKSQPVSRGYMEDRTLTRDNTTSYSPSGDYNPATKKYVDDQISIEETARIAADEALQDNIDAEEAARIEADEDIRAMFFDGTSEEWDELTPEEQEAFMVAAVEGYVELTVADVYNLQSILGSDESITSDMYEDEANEALDEIIGGE